MKITYSAPAKVILSGEHAVVYGKPAIVSAIDIRLRFSIQEGAGKRQDPHVEKIAEIVQKYLTEKKLKGSLKKSYVVTIESDIPIGRGLGSSAALSVAGAAAFLEFFSGKARSPEIANNLAYQVEKIFHRLPSGVDNSTAAFGGLVYFRKEFEFLKGIYKVAFKIPQKIEEKLYLIDSGPPLETTADMVNHVGKFYNSHAKSTEQIFNVIEKTTKRLVVSLVKEDGSFFAQQISENQQLLEKLGVVSNSTKKLLYGLTKYGVGKITGAGGKKSASGYLLFYADNPPGLEKRLKKQAVSYMKFTQSHDGVKKIL